MSDGPKWFAPQTHGYGSGLPIAWQGWAILSVFLLIVIGGGILLAPHSLIAYFSLVLPLTAIFVAIASKTTRGGWRWRWGDDQ